MTTTAVLLTSATFVTVALFFYLDIWDRSAGVKPEQDHWWVFGLLPTIIAGNGLANQNVWVSLIALLLAIVGLIFNARRHLQITRGKVPTRSPQPTPPAGD